VTLAITGSRATTPSPVQCYWSKSNAWYQVRSSVDAAQRRSEFVALAVGCAPKTDYPDKRGQIAKIDEAVIQGRAARGSGGNCNG
jgi:hypothetical protein